MHSALDENRLWPLAGAAQVAGISPELLAAAVAHGDIVGVEIVTLGPRRIRFVRADPFLRWLEGRTPIPTPAVDPCVDLLT